MWIFTQEGFVSAVRHNDKPEHLMVRARDAKSIKPLASMAEETIVNSPTADYPYRVTVHENTFKNWLDKSVTDLQYPNFKSQVAITRGRRFVNALHSVWDVMHDVEDEDSRKRI